MEGLIGGQWQPLCRVPLAPNPPYYLSTRARAREVVLSPFISGANDAAIKPGGTKIFWSGWACSRKCDLATAQLRLTLTDLVGHGETVEFPSGDSPPGKGFDVQAGVGLGGVLSLDPQKETIRERRSCLPVRP
jgi:hypothetical protein